MQLICEMKITREISNTRVQGASHTAGLSAVTVLRHRVRHRPQPGDAHGVWQAQELYFWQWNNADFELMKGVLQVSANLVEFKAIWWVTDDLLITCAQYYPNLEVVVLICD